MNGELKGNINMSRPNQAGPAFPQTRLRRNRKTQWARDLTKESSLSPCDFIWPIFVREGENIKEDVTSMPGVVRYSIDRLVEAVAEAESLGISAVAIFPYLQPELKDSVGSVATQPDNLICRAIEKLKAENLNIGIQCDVALDPFTSHGHDGLLSPNGQIMNDETVELLCKQALVQARAGCDIISPSDMMDGRVGEIRRALDKNNFGNIQITSYAAKYASGFYGPFRDALGSTSMLSNFSKATYQLDPRNSDEAMREIALDIAEGADMIMVKPGLPYLDIIYRAKKQFGIPIFGYQVSGEYAMIKAAANNQWLEHDGCMMESLIAFKRAGASGILTYFALDAARFLKNAG